MSVLTFIIALFLITAIVRYFGRNRIAKVLFISTFILFVLTSTNYLPGYLVSSLEEGFEPFQADLYSVEDTINIVVLASGYSDRANLPATSRLSLNTLGRLIEGIRIKKMLPNSRLVCSGYAAFEGESQAEIAKMAASLLGVESDEIMTLDSTKTTWDEATYSYKYFNSAPIILVTDATHMKRALFFFRIKNSNILAAPTNFRIAGSQRRHVKWLPSLSNLNLMDIALHEYFGFIKYYLLYKNS
jgi:uncharacterized SAM-binding protein YcdF (DUF218 family)